jgi:nucleoside 2-deoxyribosyltransferase
MPQRWLIEEAREQLLGFGLDVFSPIHDVGRGPANVVAEQDLRGLESCDRVFAVLDGLDAGTLFEVGYARKMGIPVYTYAELVGAENSTMIDGSGCHMIPDFASAIYHCVWKS